MKILRLGQSLCSSNGGGGSETRFVFKVDTTIAGTSGTSKFALPLSGAGINCDVDWGDGTTDTGVTAAITHTYSSTGSYDIKIDGTLKGWAFNAGGDRLKMSDISNWGVFDVSASSGFSGCQNMIVSATDAPTFSTVNVQFMFKNCNSMTADFSGWDVSGLTNIRGMFWNCNNFTSDLSGWDVSNVTTFNRTFRACTVFNSDLSAWDVGNSTDMKEMFMLATAFDSSIDRWQIQKMITPNGLYQFMNGKTAADYPSSKLADIYTRWATLTFVNTGISAGFGLIKFDASGAAGRAVLSDPAGNNWSIADGGEAP